MLFENLTTRRLASKWRMVVAATTVVLLASAAFDSPTAEARRLKPDKTPITTTTTSTPTTSTSTTAPPATTDPAPAPDPSTGTDGGAPATPPAMVCDNAAILDGPASPPAGSVRVDPGQDLNAATQARAAGTTFWLAPGTHTLGGDPYGQVVPKDGNVYIGAPGAVLDGRNINRYAFTQGAVGVTIRHLTIQNFGAIGANNNEGVVNHDGGSRWTIHANTIQGNAGAGLFIGPENTVTANCLRNNGQYGFSMYKAEAGALHSIVIDGNEISGNNTFDWESKISGCGCSGAGKFWDARNVRITNNWVHHNKGVGLWADTNNIGFVIDGNYINDNDAEAIFYEISYNARITDNTIVRNAIVKGKEFAARGDIFPISAIYLSESGGDARVNGGVMATLEISGNRLVDNWGGVALWENADRFCGSAANTSSGYCTAVNPAVTLSTCVSGTINSEPYLSDCRWKTQNVLVTNNVFSFSRANVGCVTDGCGQQVVLSNWGTYPTWSPYTGRMIQDRITFHQGNRFADNTYVGDWRFVPFETGNFLSFEAWQAAPYGQDAGSTFTASGPAPLTATAAPTPTPTPTAPAPAPAPAGTNHLDAATATIEGSLGAWVPWYSASIAASDQHARAGTASLRADIVAAHGWGVQLHNWPGFAASAGEKVIGFWGLQSAGAPAGATLTVRWRDAGGAELQVDRVTIPALSSSWQQGSAQVVAPVGTATVSVDLSGTTESAGAQLHFDEIHVLA